MRAALSWVPMAMIGLALPGAVRAQASVEESAVALDVVDRMPVGADSTFTADVGRIYCWTRVAGADGTTIHHVWFHGDEEMADIELNVGGSPWRTWSNKAIMPEWTGAWRVEVRDATGNVIETIRFTVSEM
jgi:hypothetical protein